MGIQQIPLASSGITTNDLITQPTWATLASNTGTTAVSAITITSIPTTYKTLKVCINGLKSSANGQIEMFFNNDTSGRFSIFEDGYGVTGGNTSRYYAADLARIPLSRQTSVVAPTGSTQSFNAEITVHDYANSNDRLKLIEIYYVAYNTNNDPFYGRLFGNYRPSTAAAITRIDITNNQGNIAHFNDQTSGTFVLGAK